MTGGMAAIGIAAAGAWLICYLLVERVQNRRIARRLSRNNSGPPGGIAGGDGWNLLGWSVPGWSGSDYSPSDSSGNPDYAGGGDSGACGGDGGGGGRGGD